MRRGGCLQTWRPPSTPLPKATTMKLNVEKAALLAALTPLARIVARKPTVPILGNVLLQTAGGAVILIGTDQDREVYTEAPADVDISGEVTLPCHTLLDFLRKAEAGSVSIEVEDGGGRAKVVAGRARVTLHTLPPADFPNIAESAPTSTFTMPARDLRLPIERVAYAQSTEETRYFLCGVHLHVVDKDIAFVATDGHRLGRSTIPVPAGAEALPPIILPSETVAELLKILDVEDAVTVEVNDRMARFTAGPVTIVSKLVDGTYPDYRRVIPPIHDGIDRVLKVCPKALLSAVERVATITIERGSRVTLSINDGGVDLAMRSPDCGDSSDHLEAVEYTGEPITIGFNSRYVTGVLSALGGDEIEVRMTAPHRPAVIHDPTEPATLRLMMPMAVQ